MHHANRALVLALAALHLGGCAAAMHPLAQLPLRAGAKVATAARPGRRIVILPFADQRGPEYARASPDRFIPVANLVHGRDDVYYPEQAALLRTHAHHRLVIETGTLGDALPSLLATELGQMGLPDRVALDASQPADYIVTGRIHRADLRRDHSFVLGLLSPLGVPCEFVAHRLEYDVEVYDARDRSTPIFTRTYAWRGTRNVGMYYGHEANLELFTRGLEETLPRVVTDVAAVLDARG